MGSIITYLQWRGDLTFAERPFCEADNLVLSELAYIDFSGLVPTIEAGGSRPLYEVIADFQKENLAARSGLAELPPEFLTLLANSRRFRGIGFGGWRERLDTDQSTDFTAMQFLLGDGTAFAAYRGTSSLIMGWREDFSMSFRLMPSQPLAAEHLTSLMRQNALPYRVGGHSKGGNLAVYAAMRLPPDLLARVQTVYSNDGPGLCPDNVDMARYDAVAPKLVRIVPEFSVVGALFEREPPTKIVASSANGFQQHDGFSWQLEGDSFCTVPARCAEAEYYNRVFDRWIESAPPDQRESFTRDFFDALESGGAKTVKQLAGSGVDGIESVIVSVLHSEGKTKVTVFKFLHTVVSAFGSAEFATLVREKKIWQGMALFFVGVVLTAMPEWSAQCIGACAGLIGAFWFGRKALQCAFGADRIAQGEQTRKAKAVLNMAAMCVFTYLVAQKTLLLHFSNLIMGAVFLYFAYRQAQKAFGTGQTPLARAGCAVLGVLAFLLGIVPILTADITLWQYVFSAGCFVMLLGVGKILYAMYLEGKANVRTVPGHADIRAQTVPKHLPL